MSAHALSEMPVQQFQNGRYASAAVVDVQRCTWATQHVAREDLVGAVGPFVEQELQRAVTENQEGFGRLQAPWLRHSRQRGQARGCTRTSSTGLRYLPIMGALAIRIGLT